MTETAPNIEPFLPDGRGQWSAKAVAMDAVQRCEHDDIMLCLWIDAEGRVAYSKSNEIPLREAAALACLAQEIAASAARTYFHGDDDDG